MSGPLGVIGGMGPYASAHFYKRLTELQQVKTEQDYIEVLLYSKPSIPDRTAFITNGKDAVDPFEAIWEAGRALENAGCAMLAIPCVTAHFFYGRLRGALRIPIINMVRETALCAKEKHVKKAGLLATSGTVKGGIFHRYLIEQGIETLTLPAQSQARLMEYIYEKAKKGGSPETETLNTLSGELFTLGAEAVILGCTELSLPDKSALSAGGGRSNYLDALDVLAASALKAMNNAY